MMYSFASASASASASSSAFGGVYGYSSHPKSSKKYCSGYDGCDTSYYKGCFGNTSGSKRYSGIADSMARAWSNAFSGSGWMDAWGSDYGSRSSSRASSHASSYANSDYYGSYGGYGSKGCYDYGNKGYSKGYDYGSGYSDYDYTDYGDNYTNYDNDTAIDDSYNTNSYNTYDDSFNTNTYVDNSVTNNYYNYILNSGNRTSIEDSGNSFNANVAGGRSTSNSSSSSSSTSNSASSSNSTSGTHHPHKPTTPHTTTPSGNPDWAKFEGDPIVTTKYGKYHVPLKTGQTKTLINDPSDHSKLSVTGGKSQGATFADYEYGGKTYRFNARDGAVYQGEKRLGSLKDDGYMSYDIGEGRQIVSRDVNGREVFAVRGGDSEYYSQFDQRANSKDPYWNVYMAENRDSAANDATGDVPELIRGMNHR
jgi:hypothetical protein